MRSAVLCRSANNSVWFQFDWNVQRYFVSMRKTFIDIFVALSDWTSKKNYYTHCTTKKHAKFYFRMKKPYKIFFAQKIQRKILLACGLSIRQLSALGCWSVTLLLLWLLLQKKFEYHRTCCDYLLVAACQDCSAWNKRKKLQHFYQLVANMVWDCEKVMHARSGAWRCCDGEGRAARVQCELLLAATFTVLCWTLNLHWYVLLGISKKITSRDHWITAFSQINGCYSSRCPSCLTKALC